MVILGDFNLDESKRHRFDYSNRQLFEELNSVFDPMSLIQLIKFDTWSRVVNGQVRSSVLDHLYTNDATLVSKIGTINPIIGDHNVITAVVAGLVPDPDPVYKRDWRTYTKEKLLEKLSGTDWTFQANDVQSYWSLLEERIVAVCDDLIPYNTFKNNKPLVKTHPQSIKSSTTIPKFGI